MNPILNIAIKAARKAGDIILKGADRFDKVSISKKHARDFVTDIDKRAEQEIIAIIHQHFPHHAILAEESGESDGQDYQWIIDPLDGTNNFVHQVPHYAVSIGIKHKDRIEHGVIYDPIRQEIFSASRGEGAKLNDTRLRVNKCIDIENAFMVTGFPLTDEKLLQQQIKLHNYIINTCGDVRRTGSAALDLAYVAAGRFDAYWELNLQPWDWAAGALLVREAGGLVTDITGGENYHETGNILAANPKLLAKLAQAFCRLG